MGEGDVPEPEEPTGFGEGVVVRSSAGVVASGATAPVASMLLIEKVYSAAGLSVDENLQVTVVVRVANPRAVALPQLQERSSVDPVEALARASSLNGAVPASGGKTCSSAVLDPFLYASFLIVGIIFLTALLVCLMQILGSKAPPSI